jgi:hypothetical protein
MENETIIIDTTKINKYPSFFSKEERTNNDGYFECSVYVENKDDIWKGIILSISSSGKYKVKLLSKE